ncbi:hypothetical protein O3P69_006489 [Scylla paramamosain]|uniref:Uncharacterized protein n=1 Tax=Scylla paramamosain TaxID=85552 RepID=A0AAW0U696_SCYPA
MLRLLHKGNIHAYRRPAGSASRSTAAAAAAVHSVGFAVRFDERQRRGHSFYFLASLLLYSPHWPLPNHNTTADLCLALIGGCVGQLVGIAADGEM